MQCAFDNTLTLIGSRLSMSSRSGTLGIRSDISWHRTEIQTYSFLLTIVNESAELFATKYAWTRSTLSVVTWILCLQQPTSENNSFIGTGGFDKLTCSWQDESDCLRYLIRGTIRRTVMLYIICTFTQNVPTRVRAGKRDLK